MGKTDFDMPFHIWYKQIFKKSKTLNRLEEMNKNKKQSYCVLKRYKEKEDK